MSNSTRERVIDVSENESETEPNSSHSEYEGSVEPKTKRKARDKKSDIYQYFNFDERKQRFFCKHCSCAYIKNRDGSTGNLRKHITNKHGCLLQGGELSKSMSSYIETGSIKPTEKFTNEGLLKRLIKFMIMQNQPFDMVESDELMETFRFCNPNAKLPSQTTVKSEIKKMYEVEKEAIKTILKESPGKISFILDGWTSANQFAFIGVIAEWIDKYWIYNNVMIDLKVLDGTHSGVNIAACFWEIVESYDFKSKIQSVTTDNASNMDTFFSSFGEIARQENFEFHKEENRVRCLAHILNLCCQAAVGSINSEISFVTNVDTAADNDFLGMEDFHNNNGILTKLRKCIVKIKASPQRREAFRRQCDVAELERLELVRDVQIRWNSTFDMITRALKLRKAIDCTTRADKDLSKFILTDLEWDAFEQLKNLLEPFKDITVFLSSEQFPTISTCAFVYSSTFEYLEKYEIDKIRSLKGINTDTGLVYPTWIRNAAMKAKEKLAKYYSSADCTAYVIGSVLDPRMKLDVFKKSLKLRPEVVSGYRTKLTQVWNKNYKLENHVQQEPEKESNFFQKQLEKLHNCSTDLNELDVYLKSKTVSSEFVKFGSLGWWKDHENDFPGLSKMARDYLAPCGTGVPVERLFSVGPDLLRKKRMSLSAETIRQCISLKCWLKFQKKVHVTEDFVAAVVHKINGVR